MRGRSLLPSQSLGGIYVHVPFCAAVCPYCDFAVLVGNARKRQDYAATLAQEIRLRAAEIRDLGPVDTIYFGGGTPSLLDDDQLQAILEALARSARLADDHGIYLEANPEDVTLERLAGWRALGIDTLTLGVQALDDESLAFLGRRHGASDARQAIERALAAGFDTVSFDLIYGLPGQTIDDWRRTLDQAATLGPDHLSCYQLTIEPGTPFARAVGKGSWTPARDPVQAQLFRLTHEHLADRGYAAYEVSNFARESRNRSRHNQKYWHHVPYVGVGPAAHSYDGRSRAWNERHLTRWQRRVLADETPVGGRESLGWRERALETVMLGLRTTDGLDLAACRRRLGFDLAAGNRRRIAKWIAGGLLVHQGERLWPTLDGLAVADTLASQWQLPENDSPEAPRHRPATGNMDEARRYRASTEPGA